MIIRMGNPIDALLRKWKARRFDRLTVGSGSDVYTWRIKGASGCRLTIGEDCFIRDKIAFERSGARLSIGDRTFLGNGLIAIAESVEIGNDVMFAWGVTVVDHDSHSLRFSERQGDTQRWLRKEKDWSTVNIAGVRIEDKVWIGFNASVLKGVTVGEGAIVGAGSVVTKSVPPWTVVAGNPARLVREIGADER
jgi:acetyltransferase-like isoleucine patch superfamily enzyme